LLLNTKATTISSSIYINDKHIPWEYSLFVLSHHVLPMIRKEKEKSIPYRLRQEKKTK